MAFTCPVEALGVARLLAASTASTAAATAAATATATATAATTGTAAAVIHGLGDVGEICRNIVSECSNTGDDDKAQKCGKYGVFHRTGPVFVF